MKHTYYQLVLKLFSPLSVGSGSNENTDSDVICRKSGVPYIPATAIAGTFRHYILNKNKREAIFGFTKGEKSLSSPVIFYDGELIANSTVTVRDSVKLENKVGVDGAKFDFQIVETGAEFVTFIEVGKEHEHICDDIENMVAALSVSEIRIGRKTSRGYGIIAVKTVKKAVFDFGSKDEKEKWLDFDVTDMNSWKSIPEYKIEQTDVRTDIIKLSLKQNGALSIREYTTEVSTENKTMPDYKQMSLSDGRFIIPGTSWAGAFRERFCSLAGMQMTEELFGFVNEKSNETKPSAITFSESVIENGKQKLITRNSIDRFSAATKDAALYTELTCYNGSTELIIIIPKDTDAKYRCVLSAVILDLNSGLLSLGGLTAVGRGLFEVTGLTVNGEDRMSYLKANDVKNMLTAKEDGNGSSC